MAISDRLEAAIKEGTVKVEGGKWVGQKVPMIHVGYTRSQNGLDTKHPARTDADGEPLLRFVPNRKKNLEYYLGHGYKVAEVPVKAPTGVKRSTKTKANG